jgi:general secretion pathway protein A
MYEEFFGLGARPFGITPSADLFFHSSAHRRTLACLQAQVLAGEPLIVLTGDIGAGKTTVLQVLLRNLSDKFAPAVVVSTQLDEVELTRSVLIAFGAAATGRSLDDLRMALRSRLEDLRSNPQRALLVVDEAQNFPAETLRYLMQLPELGFADEEAWLQVIISGQPGLRARARLVEGAGARVGHELPLCRLGPMSRKDTGCYVRHRLRVAGSTDGPNFSDDAIDRIQVATGGLPRLVNRLCERVLTSAYLDQTRDIGAVRVAHAAAEFRKEMADSDVPLPPVEPSRPAPAAAPMSLQTRLVPMPVGSEADSDPAPAVASLPTSPPDFGPGNPLRSPPESPKRPDSHGSRQRRPFWAAAAAAALLGVSIAWVAYDRSSPANTSRLGASASGNVVASAPRADAAEGGLPADANANARSAENSSRASHSDGRTPVAAAARGVEEPTAPSQPVDARAALGLASSTEPATTPPADTPACSEAAKVLGLCP